jgi:16S rRNA (guanine527-N7)-methyltransferase
MTRNSSGASSAAAIEKLLGALSVTASDAARERLRRYLELVLEWGPRMDLTAARSDDELLDLSLADAAVIAREELVHPDGPERWLDIGTGGGAPGIPLFILLGDARPSLTGSLVEPRTKRVMFLRTCVGELGLDRIDVKRVRSDVLPAGDAEAAVARATLPPPEWLAEGTRLATRAVWVLLAREPAPSHPGWVVDHDVSYTWPFTGAARRALRYVPVRPTG